MKTSVRCGQRVRKTKHRGRQATFLWLTLLCLSVLSCLPVATVRAATNPPKTQLSATVGYGGYYKQTDWVPVTVTIHHVGPAMPASLQVRVNQNVDTDAHATGKLQWNIQLPQNGWMDKQVDIPGAILDQGATIVCADKHGKPLYSLDVSGNAVNHVALVAVLTQRNQETQFLAGSSIGSSPVLAVAMNPAWLPTSVNALDGLSAVVATVPTLSNLSVAESKVLQTWVQLGGTLVVAGTGHASGAWKNVLPMTEGQEKSVKADDIGQFAGTPANFDVLATAGSVVPTARLWAGTNQTPLIASEEDGRGDIWQTGFSPMDPELLGWTGNSMLWTSLFKHDGQGANSGLPRLFDPSGALSLTSVGDALTPLRIPSLPVFASVFALYILVIGPLSFFILRRIRRAHYAWIVLPVVSLLTTFGIYVFGGQQRPQGLLTDGVGVLDLTGKGAAQSYAVQAFMSPYVGGLDFHFSPNTLALPMSVRDAASADNANVRYGAHATSLSFRDIGRWHVRYIYAAGVNQNVGEIKTTLTSAYGLLFGTVKNNTHYTLDHVAIMWQNHMYEVGTLKPNQKLTLNPTAGVGTSQWISDYGTYNRALTHGIGRSLGAYLSQMTAGSKWTGADARTPQAMIIATTNERTEQMPQPSRTQDISSDKRLVLVRQYAPVEPEIGDALP